jgi:hypothetical protein
LVPAAGTPSRMRWHAGPTTAPASVTRLCASTLSPEHRDRAADRAVGHVGSQVHVATVGRPVEGQIPI